MIIEIILLTAIIEFITIFARTFFGSVKEFYTRNPLPVRVHHGYIGLGFVFSYSMFLLEVYAIIGGALMLSDAIHHLGLLVLTGDSEFPGTKQL